MQSTVHEYADGQPGWLNGEPANYPNASYLYATGAASEVEVAKDRALGNLAKIFELHIRESSTTTEDVQTHKSEGEESVQSTARIASSVNVHTDKMINGARIAEQWQDPDDLTYHALAVLDRDQAGNNIRSEINRLDRETAFTMANADNRQQVLLKVADLQDAIVMQSERNSLQKTLKIIDLNGTGKPSAWNLAELIEKQEQALKSLNMRAVVLQDSVGELDKVLQAAMANAGFAQSSDEVGFTLSASMETQDALQKEGWYWLRGTLNVRLADPGGTILGNKSWPLKVSSVQQNQLNQRMLAEIDKKLKAELKNTVLGFATGGQ
jgi:Ca2+-binding EF-hand superfamily protein